MEITINFTIGSPQNAIKVQFRCTPVKCHRLTTAVTMEIILSDLNGNVVSKPNQYGSMHFRSAVMGKSKRKSSEYSMPTNVMKRKVDEIFQDLKEPGMKKETMRRLATLRKLILQSISFNAIEEHKREYSCSLSSDDE